MRPSLLVLDVDVRLAEDDEEIALAGVLEVAGHVQVGVHLRLQDRQRAELGDFRGVRVEGEGAGDQGVEARVHRLARRGDKVDAREGAELGADEDRRAPLRLAFHEAALGADIFAGPGLRASETDRVALLGLVDAGRAQMLQHHRRRSRSAA